MNSDDAKLEEKRKEEMSNKDGEVMYKVGE